MNHNVYLDRLYSHRSPIWAHVGFNNLVRGVCIMNKISFYTSIFLLRLIRG